MSYGADNVEFEYTEYPDGARSWRAFHDGPDGHEEVPIGEQCRCGWINFGVVFVPHDQPRQRNDGP